MLAATFDPKIQSISPTQITGAGATLKAFIPGIKAGF